MGEIYLFIYLLRGSYVTASHVNNSQKTLVSLTLYSMLFMKLVSLLTVTSYT